MKSPIAIVALGAFWLAAVQPLDALAKDKNMNQPTIQQLIEALVNKNAPPAIIKAKQAAQFPPNYDWAEQARVLSVWQQLNERAEEALPELIEHLNDKQYCVSYEVDSTGAWHNRSVGFICWYIMSANIEAYQSPFDHRFSNAVPPFGGKVREWWEQHKGMSLSELQSEAISAAKEKHRTRKSIPNGGPITDQDRKEDISMLEKLTKQIEEAGKPISVKAFSPRSFRNYPWPPKKEQKGEQKGDAAEWHCR